MVKRSALVPGSPADFSKPTYWESFFQERVKSFEWYGNYLDLQDVIHRYIKPHDRILVAGCGNSELSENMYDAGLRNITNIDISHAVIDQMNSRKLHRETMLYVQMDLTKMDLYDDTFTVIFDKGTLDALMSDNTPESNATVDKVFSEYQRVLKIGGRYICVTLAQDYILQKILSYFPNNSWLVRIHKIEMVNGNASSALPVFVFVMTKFNNLPRKMLEICPEGSFNASRVEDESKIVSYVNAQQEYSYLVLNYKKKVDPEREGLPIHLFDQTKDSVHPRFTLCVVDQAKYKVNQRFAVFIIPQGKSTIHAFRTHAARKKVASETPFQRVLFTMLLNEHQYGTLEEVQQELNSIVMDFAPPGVTSADKVPYLSMPVDDMEQRVLRYEGKTEISGKIVVEDFCSVLESSIWYRQLILKNTETNVMTEMRLKAAAQKRQKDGAELVPDHTFLLRGHERPILAGIFLKYNPDHTFRAMMLGVGGGSMSCFILKNFPNCNLTAVELDPGLIDVAHEWFDLPVNSNRFQAHGADAVKFVYDLKEKLDSSENSDREKYDVIVVDIMGNEGSIGLSSPIISAVEQKYLEALYSVLKTDGLLIINLLCFNETMRAKVMYNIRRTFKTIVKTKCSDFHNEVLYCFKDKPEFKMTTQKPKNNKRKQNKQQKSKKSQSKIDKKLDKPDNIELKLEDLTISRDSADTSRTSDSGILGPTSGDREISTSSDNGVKEENGVAHDKLKGISVLDETFVPPSVKFPIGLSKYDSDWLNFWKEKAGLWFKKTGMDFNESVSKCVVERDVDYYNPPRS